VRIYANQHHLKMRIITAHIQSSNY